MPGQTSQHSVLDAAVRASGSSWRRGLAFEDCELAVVPMDVADGVR